MTVDSPHFHKAVRLYHSMVEAGHVEEVDEIPVTVFRGNLSDLFKSVRPGLSMSDYGRLMRGLKQCGCVTLLQKGARNTDTVLVLHHPPEMDRWKVYEDAPLTKALGESTLLTQMNKLRKEVEHQRTLINHLAKAAGVELPRDDPPEPETQT